MVAWCVFLFILHVPSMKNQPAQFGGWLSSKSSEHLAPRVSVELVLWTPTKNQRMPCRCSRVVRAVLRTSHSYRSPDSAWFACSTANGRSCDTCRMPPWSTWRTSHLGLHVAPVRCEPKLHESVGRGTGGIHFEASQREKVWRLEAMCIETQRFAGRKIDPNPLGWRGFPIKLY